jgi:hypothetical protein
LSPPSVGHSALAALAGVATALAVEALQETIVRRRQAYTDRAMIEADDAIRASSAAACTGVGLAALMGLVASQLWDIGLVTTFRPVRWSAVFLGLALGVGALAAWSTFGLGYARVVRREPQASSRPS